MAFSRAQLSWQSSAQSQAPTLLECNSQDSEYKTPSSWFCLKIHVKLLVVVCSSLSMWNTHSTVPICWDLLVQSFPQSKVSQEVLVLYLGPSLGQDPVTSLGHCQYIEVHMFVLFCADLSVLFCANLSEMGFFISKESSSPPSGTPYFMTKSYILRSNKYLPK